MPNQNNLIRPSSTVYSASSTMKLHDTASEKERKKTSIVILTLLSLIIFLFILCEYLKCKLCRILLKPYNCYVVQNQRVFQIQIKFEPHMKFNLHNNKICRVRISLIALYLNFLSEVYQSEIITPTPTLSSTLTQLYS